MLGVDSKGTGIEFVESWHEKKFMLQLVLTGIIGIIVAGVVGLKTGSKETGFTVFGAVIAISRGCIGLVATATCEVCLTSFGDHRQARVR
jgi:uncharacterized membrane protein HdeD (DUF308 family)